MAQANPQFTPVQILEAGERALADGRSEYASQFFQHLIDHYGSTPEAAAARDAMARLNGSAGAAQVPQYVNSNGHVGDQIHNPSAHTQSSQTGNGTGATEPAFGREQDRVTTAPPAYAPPPAPNRPLNGGVHLNGLAANGHAPNGHAHENGAANGLIYAGQPAPGHPPMQAPRARTQQPRNEPAFGRSPLSREQERDIDRSLHEDRDMPRHLARYDEQKAAAAHSTSKSSHRLFAPAPEKNYIIGRVISGLLLFIGIAGAFAGIILLYAAISDPRLFAQIGMDLPAQALVFSVSVFIASIVMLIVSQVATALFDNADATADLARLQRHRLGDTDEDE